MDLLIFVFSISGLALLFFSSLAVTSAAVYLSRQSRRSGSGVFTLEAGSAIRTGFALPALARLPLVRVEWQWTRPTGIDCRQRLEGRQLVEEVVAERRCRVQGIERRFVVSGAFGLSRVAWAHTEAKPVTVLPRIGRLKSMPVVQSMSAAEGIPYPTGAADGDRMEIRRYTPGDSMRHVLWKTYARTRQLNVRTPERSIDRSQRTVAYLLTGERDEPAAAAARVALTTGLLGEHWLFAADGGEPTDDLDEALRQIAASGSLLPEAGAEADGLKAFLDHPEIRGEVHCVIFAQAHPGPWIEPILAIIAAMPAPISFVLGTDGVEPEVHSPWWHRLLFTEPERPPSTSSQQLNDVMARLEASGHGILVVDRSSGRSHGSVLRPARSA